MKTLLTALLLQFAIAANFTVIPFSEWKQRYGKTYPDAAEEAMRQRVYNARVAELLESNCSSCAITKFTADTDEEIRARTNLLLPPDIVQMAQKQRMQQDKIKLSSEGATSTLKLAAPSSLDWRELGAVTPVKAQGSCGTCWSFTTVAMCQSSLILQGKAFNNRIYSMDLSQQYLLKCTPGSSCSGGYLENSIDKAIEKGLPYERQFPYNPYGANNNGICSTTDLIPVSNATRVSKYYTTDEVIINMLLQGPIAIAVSATGWQSYNSGVYQCPINAPINHAVLLVGYTNDYWIIKNSWGKDWGQDGFIYVTRNQLRNCGIGTAVHSLFQRQINALFLLLFGLLCCALI